jgi:hypothetical protein
VPVDLNVVDWVEIARLDVRIDPCRSASRPGRTVEKRISLLELVRGPPFAGTEPA